MPRDIYFSRLQVGADQFSHSRIMPSPRARHDRGSFGLDPGTVDDLGVLGTTAQGGKLNAVWAMAIDAELPYEMVKPVRYEAVRSRGRPSRKRR